MNYKTDNEKKMKVLGIDAEGNNKFDLNIKEITVKEAADADLYLPCDMPYFRAITFLRARVLFNKTLTDWDLEFIQAHADVFPVKELIKELTEESKKLKEKEAAEQKKQKEKEEADQKKQSDKESANETKEKKEISDDKVAYEEGLNYKVIIPKECDSNKKKAMIRYINAGFEQVKEDVTDKEFMVSEIHGATNFVMTEVGGDQIVWIHRDPEGDDMMIELASDPKEHDKNVKEFKKLMAKKKDKESKQTA